MKNSYFRFNFPFIVELSLVLFIMALNAYVYVGFFCGSIAFSIWAIYIIPPLYTILCIGVTLNFTYPVVFQEEVEIRWFFYPFLNKSFAYSKIDHVLFLRKVTYGAHFTMTIFMKDGKKNRYGDLLCMDGRRLKELLEDLRSHGVEVDNQLRITDIP